MSLNKNTKPECKICASANITDLGNIINGKFPHDFLKKFFLFKCKQCSFKFIHPSPSNSELDYIYSSQEYSQWENPDNKNKLHSSRYLNFDYYSKIIQKFKKKGRILDCGCATGLLLDIMKERGFDCYGAEISDTPFLISEKKHPGKIFKSKIDELSIPDEYFDIITMFDLIEHVENPRSVLEKANSLLSNNGLLFIITPNMSSLSAILMGKRHNDCIMEHLSLFNKKNMSRLLNEAGFEVMKTFPAKKIINLKFAESVFARHTNPLAYPLRLVNKLLPDMISQIPVKLYFGGMFVIAKKLK